MSNDRQLAIDFSIPRAEEARDEAIDRVAEGAGDDWMATAIDTIRLVALSKAEFTTDDIWLVLESPPNDPRALGAAMRWSAAQGICAATDRFVRSRRVVCHRRPLAVWTSLVYVGGEA